MKRTYRIDGRAFHPRFRDGEFLVTDSSEPKGDGAEMVILFKDGTAQLVEWVDSRCFREDVQEYSMVVARLKEPVNDAPIISIDAR